MIINNKYLFNHHIYNTLYNRDFSVGFVIQIINNLLEIMLEVLNVGLIRHKSTSFFHFKQITKEVFLSTQSIDYPIFVRCRH